MKLSGIVSACKYYWQFMPFRINFILFIGILLFSKQFVFKNYSETSSFLGIMLLMAKVALIFTSVIVAISFLSSFLCFLYFQYQTKKRGISSVHIEMDTDSKQDHFLKIRTKLPYALKPVLGFVKIRLMYDNKQFTDKYIMNERLSRNFFAINTGLAGNNTLLLPDIKEYTFSKALVYFEDMLQFFTFTALCKVENSICNLPHSLIRDINETTPKKTEEEIVRIEQLRKVEGELLHYKKFEASDDVRRIVWKIFAKNKELVVRIPEIMDPFASHIYMYASFYHFHNFHLFSEFEQVMINHYKNAVWTIYDSLSKKEFDVRYIPDQSFHFTPHDKSSVRQAIALSEWHHDKSPLNYFKPTNGSILCIHSFTPPEELKMILASTEPNTSIFFVQLSKVFKSHYILNLMLRIFLKPSPDRLSILRNKWAWHPLKFQTLNNEKALVSLIQKSHQSIELI